jgi:hypothetical protein
MVDLSAEHIEISDDIAAGEIVNAEMLIENKSTGVYLEVRVVINNEDVVQISLSDLPLAKRKQNRAALEKLQDILEAELAREQGAICAACGLEVDMSYCGGRRCEWCYTDFDNSECEYDHECKTE